MQLKIQNGVVELSGEPILKSVNIEINDQSKIAVVGRNGCGKTTLLKLIYDSELVENYIEYSGEIIRNGAVFGYLAQEISDFEKELSGISEEEANLFREILGD